MAKKSVEPTTARIVQVEISQSAVRPSTISTTQRAYTIKLRPTETKPDWSEPLWRTHWAINAGAKIFGEWLLTFRGGLPADFGSIQTQPTVNGKGKSVPAAVTELDRRLVLTMGWLSVESREGAPSGYTVFGGDQQVPAKEGTESPQFQKLAEVLRVILKDKGVDQETTKQWVEDCRGFLSAAIREDAVWVNRAQAFAKLGITTTPDDLWDLVGRIMEKTPSSDSESDYLLIGQSKEEDKNSSTEQETEPEDATGSDSYASASDVNFNETATAFCSHRFGTGHSTDFQVSAEKWAQIGSWAATVTGEASWRDYTDATGDADHKFVFRRPGPKSPWLKALFAQALDQTTARDNWQRLAQHAITAAKKDLAKVGQKGPRDYSDQILKSMVASLGAYATTKFMVCVDHALRRVSLVHTNTRKREAERRAVADASERLAKLQAENPELFSLLEHYEGQRTDTTQSLGEYRIRPEAIQGWTHIIGAWERLKDSTAESRKAAVRSVQGSGEVDKFGDGQVFEALAEDDFWTHWQTQGGSRFLPAYVKARHAEQKSQWLKVPAYRHPHPIFAPVWVDYGDSRPTARFTALSPNSAITLQTLPADLAETIQTTEFQWSGRRYRDEILRCVTAPIAKAARHHRLAPPGGSGLDPSEFDKLACRLQANRFDLESIAHQCAPNTDLLDPTTWPPALRARLDRAGWGLTLTPKLPVRPRHGNVRLGPKGGVHSRQLVVPFPGLRILGADLGLRYAAACAVWECLSTEQLNAKCEELGHTIRPKATDLFFHMPDPNNPRRKIIHRRIQPDGTDAPWARLERSFLIRLDGENRTLRAPTDRERTLDGELAHMGIGYRASTTPDGNATGRGRRNKTVADLRHQILRGLTLALRRHADQARIALNLRDPDNNNKAVGIRRALEIWHQLTAIDRAASDQWNWVRTRAENRIPLPDSLAGAEVGSRRRSAKKQDEYSASLQPAVGKILQADLRTNLAQWWETQWTTTDGAFTRAIRMARDLVLPRRSRIDALNLEKPGLGTRTLRGVGGMSLARIEDIRTLYKLQKAYFQRLQPFPTHERPTIKEGFSRRALLAMERLREQRVKQLASRLLEAALGLGSEPGHRKGANRATSTVALGRQAPCHAIVIENLKHYRPDVHKLRRENRGLALWASAKVEKHLEDQCKLAGIHLTSVQPNWTSKQDSRTGAPGARCAEVAPEDLLHPWPGLDKVIQHAEDSRSGNSSTAVDRLVLAYRNCWSDNIWTDQQGRRWQYNAKTAPPWTLLDKMTGGGQAPLSPNPVRIPMAGGEFFVSVHHASSSGGIHADLNAAANIGLKALMHPDLPSRYWYVPTLSAAPGTVESSRMAGSRYEKDLVHLELEEDPVGVESEQEDSPGSARKNRKAKKAPKSSSASITNFWRDPSGEVEIPTSGWLIHDTYWKKVTQRVAERLLARLSEGSKDATAEKFREQEDKIRF